MLEGLEDLAPYVPVFLQGLRATVVIGVSSILVMLVTGFALAFLRRVPSRATYGLATTVIEFMRGNSGVVLLFWVFFAVPLLPGNLQPSGYFAGIVVLGVSGGAYAAEIIRGAIRAVPQGQYDACEGLGIGFWRREMRIVLPQAVPMAIPALSSMSIELFKWTAVVSLVTVPDLIHWATVARAEVGHTILLYSGLVVVYFVLGRLIALAYRIPAHFLSPTVPAKARNGRALDNGMPIHLPASGVVHV